MPIRRDTTRGTSTSNSSCRTLSPGRPQTTEVAGLQMKNDGNNVSLDRESRLLAENALRFNVASNLLRVQIQSIRSAIKEGQSS